jgi:hypothetical protein
MLWWLTRAHRCFTSGSIPLLNEYGEWFARRRSLCLPVLLFVHRYAVSYRLTRSGREMCARRFRISAQMFIHFLQGGLIYGSCFGGQFRAASTGANLRMSFPVRMLCPAGLRCAATELSRSAGVTAWFRSRGTALYAWPSTGNPDLTPVPLTGGHDLKNVTDDDRGIHVWELMSLPDRRLESQRLFS